MTKLKQPINPKSPHKHVVYKHTCVITGKSYIGLTNNYHRRIIQHLNTDSCSIFYRSIKKYGWQNFTHEFLATGLSLQAAVHFEEFYIRTHDTMSPNGYNLTSGGETCVVSEETRAKISASNIGKHCSYRTEEAKAKMSEAAKNRPPMSEETKAKISVSVSAILTGGFVSNETKAKISVSVRKPYFKLEYQHYLNNISVLPKDAMFTAIELSKLLANSCAAYTIRNRVHDGEFPNAHKNSRPIRIPITDVIAYYEKYKAIYLPD